jgi:phosphatidylserine/phosphatidylglycerophosphate/cardiolipin synthase-like enzyme
MRYYKQLIVNAEHEVMIATNYWEPSWASHFIHDALIELSTRHTNRPTKPVVKLLFDRGNPKQVIKNHQPVLPKQWASLGIPLPEEIPNIELQVMNYHRPIMGTFHAKYMVVDRRIAILSSNNIQDRVNLEQMIHLEGPIVESFYDMSLMTFKSKISRKLFRMQNSVKLSCTTLLQSPSKHTRSATNL